LVAHQRHRFGGRTDERHPRPGHAAGERRVFRQEPVAGMDHGGAGSRRDLEDLPDVQVGLDRGSRAKQVRLVGHLDVEGVAVGLRVDGDGWDPELPTGADHADRDFAAIRDQDALPLGCDNRSPRPSNVALGGTRRGRSDPMLTEHSVAEAAAAAGLPAQSAYVASTGSPNADLMASADAGAPAWTVLVAGYQAAGRG